MCADHLHLVLMSRAVWSTGCHGTCLLWKTAVLMHLRRNEHWNIDPQSTGQLDCEHDFWASMSSCVYFYCSRRYRHFCITNIKVMNIRTIKKRKHFVFSHIFCTLCPYTRRYHVFMSESLNHSFKWFVKILIHSITKQVNKLNSEPHTTLIIPAIEIHSKMVRTSMRLRIHQVILQWRKTLFDPLLMLYACSLTKKLSVYLIGLFEQWDTE